MRHFSPQLKKILIRINGCVLIPLLLCVPLFCFGTDDYNVTGLLNLKDYVLLFHILAIVLLFWTDLLLWKIMKKQHVTTRILIPLNILILLALFLPYEEGKSTLNTLHILAAYTAFVIFTCLFVKLMHMNQIFLNIFIMTCILCLLLSLTAGKVTGLSEVLFGSITSILLAFSVTE